MLENTLAVPQKTFIRSSQVTIPPCGSSKANQIQRKLFVKEALRSRWSLVSSAKLVMWRLFHLSIVGRSILSGTPQFVCLKSLEKFEKRTREDESLFTTTMRTLTHRLKAALFWAGQPSNKWWMVSPDLAPIDFLLFPHIKKKFVLNNFRRQ